MQKLMVLFKAESRWQLAVIFVVFAVTGSAAVVVTGPWVLNFFMINTESLSPVDLLATTRPYHLPDLSVVTDYNWYVSRTV